MEYWIADLDARVVERWTPGVDRPEVIAGVLIWSPEGASVPFSLDAEALFAEAMGER